VSGIEDRKRRSVANQSAQPSRRSYARGEAVWRKWCSEWHATDPHLTALRQDQLTRHVVDNLWGATDRHVSPKLRRNMMTAAKLAIRAHWPASIASRGSAGTSPTPDHHHLRPRRVKSPQEIKREEQRLKLPIGAS
jgi:hypothetical protein